MPEAIGMDYIALPSEPHTQECEFCDEQASLAYTLVEWKMYVYVCAAPQRQGEQAVARGKPSRPRRQPCPESEQLFNPAALGAPATA